MTNNNKISLSICQGFQITYFMSQQFSSVLIIEFVEIDNRGVRENNYFRSNASKFGMLHECYKHVTGTTARGNVQNLTI